MSIVVRSGEGSYFLLSKGADGEIYSLLDEEVEQRNVQVTQDNVLQLS